MLKMHNSQKLFSRLLWLFLSVAILGSSIGVGAALSTILEKKMYSLDFCMSNDCIIYFGKELSAAFTIFKETLSLLVSIATIGGIVVAVSNYLNVAQTNALNNHISHFKIFQDYVAFEIGKRNMLNISSVDMFRWYNLIFHSSRTGSMDISGEYVEAMKEMNYEISKSNEQAQSAKEGSYRYKEHQSRISKKINFFGIKLGFHPRNDFDEIERQIFDLISSVNKAFCPNSIVPDIESVHYRR